MDCDPRVSGFCEIACCKTVRRSVIAIQSDIAKTLPLNSFPSSSTLAKARALSLVVQRIDVNRIAYLA
jgi:hypothetical protein